MLYCFWITWRGRNTISVLFKIAFYPCRRERFYLHFLLQHEFEPAENMKPKEGQEMSKSAAKNKKKREAKARAKQEQETSEEVEGFTFYVRLSGNIWHLKKTVNFVSKNRRGN